MRPLCLLVPLLVLLLLAGAGAARLAGPRPAPGGTACGGAGEARLHGRRPPEDETSGGADSDLEAGGRTGRVVAHVAGPAGKPHTEAVRLRLLAEREPVWTVPTDETEDLLRETEAHVVNELSHPCGVLLSGREYGEGPDVDETPWVDSTSGAFRALFNAPYDVEALYVYGGRIRARAPLTDSGTRLVVDPETVFAGTGELELAVRRYDTGDTVGDVALEIRALDRDASTRAGPVLDDERTIGVRPFRFRDLAVGAYHIRVEREGPPWTFGVATVEVRPGEATRETITLRPGASFSMRWFRLGRPTGSVYTTVNLRDDEDRLHELPVRTDPDDGHLLRVDRAPSGRSWLVIDQHAHPLDLGPRGPGPELVVRLQDWAYVVLAVRCDALAPLALAKRNPSHWVVRDDQGVIVEEDRLALTPGNREDDGAFWGWAHLPPGQYHARWQLTPDLVAEADFEVPAGIEEVCVELVVLGA